MKRIRLACLLTTLVVLMAHPQVLRAEPVADSCNYCSAFKSWCDGFCHEHGGVMLCEIHVGFYCSDFCYCVDQTIYQDSSGMCSPCVGG